MKSKIVTVFAALFGLMMINSGLNKFFNYMPMPEMPEEVMKVMTAFMTISWLLPLVGVVEVIAGLLVIFPKTRALGSIMILPVTVGIFLHHAVLAPDGLAIGLIFLGLNAYFIYDNKEKFQSIIA